MIGSISSAAAQQITSVTSQQNQVRSNSDAREQQPEDNEIQPAGTAAAETQETETNNQNETQQASSSSRAETQETSGGQGRGSTVDILV